MTIDFHSHILPDMDDGSASVAESLAMLRLEASQGIRYVVATPHFYPQEDTPEAFLLRRTAACLALEECLQSEPELPRIIPGAEVAFFRGMSESDALPQLSIGGTKAILIEMPPPPWPDSYYRELERIRLVWGLTPIIAHIDRYIAPLRTHRIPAKLARMPLLVQANASFFLNRSTRSMALRLLRAGQIHVLGSDCHNLTDRKPNLGEAREIIRHRLGREPITRIREYGRGLLELADSADPMG